MYKLNISRYKYDIHITFLQFSSVVLSASTTDARRAAIFWYISCFFPRRFCCLLFLLSSLRVVFFFAAAVASTIIFCCSLVIYIFVFRVLIHALFSCSTAHTLNIRASSATESENSSLLSTHTLTCSRRRENDSVENFFIFYVAIICFA